ncbi:glycosyltransferase family 2 protein [Acidiphilium sp. AL]|uniref:glycosyltransferase family 2 protein n=1 Tax=Acidiphilium sp. AL TaxID=2871704 RepID=UPI0021CB1CEF|nr:glycosyltransferase family 2 protein [Acidiphilium sp. AL]MCU4161321.1 glycosyltransferase family 2 protein [Acidiphilium sp. AL]
MEIVVVNRQIFEISTVHQSQLFIEHEERCVVSAQKDQAASRGYVPIYGVSTENPRYIALVSADGSDFAVQPHAVKTSIAMMRAVVHAESSCWNLLHPSSFQYLSAQPIDSEAGFGAVIANRISDKEWEEFRATTIFENALPPGTDQKLSILMSWVEAENPIPGILQYLKFSADPQICLLGAVIPFLTPEEFQILASETIADKELQGRIRDLFKGDIWAEVAMPDLLAWREHRNAAASSGIRPAMPQEWDFLATAGQHGYPASFPHIVNSFARRAIKPRRSACVVATARNEGIYLVEWIAYHRAIGFEHIFIYSNDNDDGSDKLLEALARNGVITWVRNEVGTGTRAQIKAYTHALSVMPDILDYRWALFIDLDEFFVYNPDIFASLSDFLEFHESRECDAIAINWAPVGSDGIDEWNNSPVTCRFTALIEEGVNHYIKCMFKPTKFFVADAHCPVDINIFQSVFRNSHGNIHKYFLPKPGLPIGMSVSDEPNVEFASVYHYFYKSTQEFLWKSSRNRGDHPKSDGLIGELHEGMLSLFLSQHHAENKIQEKRLVRCAHFLDKEMQRILDFSEIQIVHESIIDTFRTALNMLLMRHAIRAASHAISDVEREFFRYAKVPIIPTL